mgnify:CR=1 FL=1
METVRKVFPFEVKEVSPRVLEFVGSTEDRDRMGDVIQSAGWQLKQYRKNPVFLWAHRYDEPPVGKANRIWMEDGKLKFHVQFPSQEEYEFADTIYKLYKGGYLRATSVGFKPLESEPLEIKEGEEDFPGHQPTRYIRQELLELSGCPVPANPNALAEAKEAGLLTMKMMEALAEKPYPNEHSCRLKDPGDFQEGSFRRAKREHEGKEYGVIMGRLKGEETMTEQSYRYPKDIWQTSEARSHCNAHDGTFEAATGEVKVAISYQSAHPNGTPKAGEGEDWDAGAEVMAAEVDDLKVMCAIVQGDPELKTSYKLPHHKAVGGHAIVWRAVAAAGAVLMGGRGGIDATDAEKGGAKAHLGKHYQEFDREPPWEKGITQGELEDEMDYLYTRLREAGLSPNAKAAAHALAGEILRISGDDIPLDIAEKIGAVLNKQNRERLNEIRRLAQEVLDSAERAEGPEPEKLTEEDIVRIVEDTVQAAILSAQGKITRR